MISSSHLFNIETFEIAGEDDELHIDHLCHDLLILFHSDLIDTGQIDPLLAGSMARGADYFLRDYMIDCQRMNIFKVTPDLLRGFAGNWYIVGNIDPSMAELAPILAGIRQFYFYCQHKGLITPELFETITEICNDHSFFQGRIDSFFAIKNDGYITWKNDCPIP